MSGEQKYIDVDSIHGPVKIAWQEGLTPTEVVIRFRQEAGRHLGALHRWEDTERRIVGERLPDDEEVQPGRYVFVDAQEEDA